MTARRSLYGKSLIRNASTVSFNNASIEPTETYYSLSLINPTKPIEEDTNTEPNSGVRPLASNTSSSVNLSNLGSTNGVKNGADGDELSLPKYNFKVVSWTPSDKPYSTPDCDEDDVIDVRGLIAKQEAAAAAAAERANSSKKIDANGLSAADIRGAVGVEEGISGFSASHSAPSASEPTKNTEVPQQLAEKVAEDTKTPETSVQPAAEPEQLPEATQESSGSKDMDGDASMS